MTFLYLIGFEENLLVSKSLDSAPTDSLITALLINLALIGLCGLNVEMKELNDSDQFILTIEGEPSEKDIELSAKFVCPKTIQFLDFKPKWEGGVQGLIQLITLVHIDQVLTKKMV